MNAMTKDFFLKISGYLNGGFIEASLYISGETSREE